jgi:hypothetical protein
MPEILTQRKEVNVGDYANAAALGRLLKDLISSQ